MNRFSSDWRMAKRLATVMESMMTIHSIGFQRSTIAPKTFVRMMHSVRAAAPLETTLR